MSDAAVNWLIRKNEERRANCIFLMGLISATQAEAEKLGFSEISEKLMHLVIESRYAVLDELLDMSSSSNYLYDATIKKHALGAAQCSNQQDSSCCSKK
jgi:hypothetical protein